MSLTRRATNAGFALVLAAFSLQASAELGIDASQLEFEAWGNGRETGTASEPTAINGTTPWAPTVQKGFLGFNFDDNADENDGFRFIPPDPIGAAGHSRVIAVVNTMIESRNKGGQLKWRSSLANFFAPLEPETFTFDPKIVYDQYKDRFVVVTLEQVRGSSSAGDDNKSRIYLAVSKDGNPQTPTEADWHYFAIDAKQTIFGAFDGWADYPGFEVDEEAVYVTANIFTFNPFGFFGGNRLWIVPKAGFYDGSAPTSEVYDPASLATTEDDSFFATTMMPAQVFGAGGVGGASSSIGTFLVAYSGLTFGGPGNPEAIQVITVDDPLGRAGGPMFIGEFVEIGNIENVGGPCGFPALPDAPQAGGPQLIEVNDRRALDAVWRDGSLWMTTTIEPADSNTTCDSLGITKAHWIQMDTSAGPGGILLSDNGNIDGVDIATDATTFFPAVAVNREGVAKFGFSASSPDIFAGAFVAGREPNYPAGVLGPTETVKAGEDYYIRTFGGTRNRWGDYSGIAVDPSNDKFFWVFNEYAAQRSETQDSRGHDGRWGTAWGRVK